MRAIYCPRYDLPVSGIRGPKVSGDVVVKVEANWDERTKCGCILATVRQPSFALSADSQKLDERINACLEVLKRGVDVFNMTGHEGVLGMTDTFLDRASFIEYAVYWASELRQAVVFAADLNGDLTEKDEEAN